MATTVSLIDSSNNASGWIWDLGNGIILDTLSTITYTYSQPGTYTICLTAYNNCDSSTSCQVIDVTTSLNQLMRQGNFSLSPIPTQESLRIQMINIKSQLIHARVLSLDGKRLVDKPVTYDESSETIFLNVEFLDPGVYILTLFAQEGFFTRRIVKL
jgi:PKD repeat protein